MVSLSVKRFKLSLLTIWYLLATTDNHPNLVTLSILLPILFTQLIPSINNKLFNNSVTKEDSIEDVLKNIIERDRIDSTRVESPLKKAEDAIEIDTTGNTIEEVKEKILLVIEEYKNKNLSQ